MLEKTLESPLDCKEIKLVNPTGNQSWIFIGGTDAEAEAPILWLPDEKNRLTGKDPDAGEDWRQEEKGTTEDKMNMSLSKLWENGEGQESLACCSPWGWKESDMTATTQQQWTWQSIISALLYQLQASRKFKGRSIRLYLLMVEWKVLEDHVGQEISPFFQI